MNLLAEKTHAHPCSHTCTHTHALAHTHTHTHSHTHSHTHTHTHALSLPLTVGGDSIMPPSVSGYLTTS